MEPACGEGERLRAERPWSVLKTEGSRKGGGARGKRLRTRETWSDGSPEESKKWSIGRRRALRARAQENLRGVGGGERMGESRRGELLFRDWGCLFTLSMHPAPWKLSKGLPESSSEACFRPRPCPSGVSKICLLPSVGTSSTGVAVALSRSNVSLEGFLSPSPAPGPGHSAGCLGSAILHLRPWLFLPSLPTVPSSSSSPFSSLLLFPCSLLLFLLPLLSFSCPLPGAML